ncbi:MAG: hypothetical protein V4592_02835 [Bacteroidota bacterium]
MKACLKYILIIFTALAMRVSYAQKLPNKQEASVWVPTNVKIDGKASEWNDKFQAHNDATNLFYTIANSDDFIYLIVHTKDPLVIETITSFGFIFDLQAVEKNSNKDNQVKIKFPLDDVKRLGLFLNKPGTTPDTSADALRSVMTGNNNILQQRHKAIIVNGIEGLDTLSIYNDTGVKAVEAFDIKRNYTLEIAIPIKCLKFLKSSDSKLSYHLLINGFAGSKINARPLITPPNLTPEEAQAVAEMEIRINGKYARTDFWGEYTLARKP